MLWGLIFSCLLCSQPTYEDTGWWWDSESWWRDSGSECDPWISIRDEDGERVDELDFGTVSQVGTTELGLFIENKGDCDLEVQGMALGDPNSAFAVGELEWPVIEPGGRESLTVSFSPTEAGDFSDTLYIQSNDPFSEFVEVQLSGSLSSGALEAQPDEVDFGTVYVGCDASQDIALTNPGPGPLTIDSITMDSASEEFSFASDTVPATLEAEESLTLRVAYAPTDEFEDVAYLTVGSSAPDNPELLLSATGNGAYAGMESEDFVQSGSGRVFVLTEVAVESTVEVRVEGVIAGGWSFDASANAVVFDEGNVPSEGATITVAYARQAVCDEE